MAYKEMNVANVRDGGGREFAFENEEALAAAGESDAVLIPDDIQSVVIAITPAGGSSAQFQFSIDPIATVKSGAGITWNDSDTGLSATAFTDAIWPCTAIRLQQTGAGTSKMTVRAQ